MCRAFTFIGSGSVARPRQFLDSRYGIYGAPQSIGAAWSLHVRYGETCHDIY
jgi:hypothetical protein